jgi:hypothetical protein
VVIVCNAEPVGMNRGGYDEPVVVFHGVLCRDSGYEPWCVILSQ